MANVAKTIKEITRNHLLNNNGLLYGQCVTAVGWVGGTVPELSEKEGIVELPISDVSNGGIVVGSALVGRRPIYVIRYQGFAQYNMITILNYAAKSKDMWNRQCPLFVRGIGMEGGIGPVASHMHHGMIMRMPGIKVFAPMTPNEWKNVWQYFLDHDDPVYCSEHRLSFDINYEMGCDIRTDYSNQYIIFAIGAARLNAMCVHETIYSTCVFHITQLKPYIPTLEHIIAANQGLKVLVVDSDYSTCGAAEHIAQKLSEKTNRHIDVLGLEDRTAGFSYNTDVVTPSTEQMIDRLLKQLC